MPRRDVRDVGGWVVRRLMRDLLKKLESPWESVPVLGCGRLTLSTGSFRAEDDLKMEWHCQIAK